MTILDLDPDPLAYGVALARFEFLLLDELGFGLDIYSSAVSGETEGLSHVSPKTGRAVTRAEAEPYLDKLLPLPGFMKGEGAPDVGEIAEGFRLTGHFLDRHVWTARQISPPATRAQLIAMLE